MVAVVYALECSATGYAYIGCTKGNLKPALAKRFREHRCLLNKGVHSSTKMLADWQQFGPASFGMKVLEELPDDASTARKRDAELRWMDTYDRAQRLYNQHKVSFQPTPEAMVKGVAHAHDAPGNRWTSEANLRRSLAQLGKPKGHGAKISATKRAKRAMR